MRNALLCCALMLLTGCDGVNVLPHQVAAAEKLCEPNGGLKYLHLNPNFNSHVVYCNNGAVFYPLPKAAPEVPRG